VHCLKEAVLRDGLLGIDKHGVNDFFFKGVGVGKEIQLGDVKSNLLPYDSGHFNRQASVYEQMH
jgi:hypothetical protein